MNMYSFRIFKEILAVVVISQGIFLTGFTYSIGEVISNSVNKDTLVQEGFSSFRDSALNSIGCLVSAYTVEYLGRKKTIQISFFSFICAGILVLCNYSSIFTSISHAITAISLGTKPVFIIYVLEVSQKNHRGMLISLYMIFGSLGLAASYAMIFYFQMKTLAATSIIIAVIGFCGTSLLPETKYWYLMHNQIGKAKYSSSWFDSFQTSDDIDKEINQIRSNSEESQVDRYQNFIVATALLICRAGCGKVVFTLFPNHYYSQFETDFLKMPMPIVQNLASFVVTVAFTAIVDKFKRRHMLYLVTIGSILTLVAIILIDSYSLYNFVKLTLVQPLLLLFYAAMINGFMDGLITIMSAEMISCYNRRGVILNVGYICCFAAQILYAVCFPYMILIFGMDYLLISFLMNDIVILMLNIFFVSETAGKDLHEFGLFVTSI